jgi:hypothetical protein
MTRIFKRVPALPEGSLEELFVRYRGQRLRRRLKAGVPHGLKRLQERGQERRGAAFFQQGRHKGPGRGRGRVGTAAAAREATSATSRSSYRRAWAETERPDTAGKPASRMG